MRLVSFLHGMVAMGCAIAAIFFLRFWNRSRDRLFLYFSIAFLILSISYVLLGTVMLATEWRIYVFVLRLLAFCTILFGIYEKNRR